MISEKVTSEQVRHYKKENPGKRERDIARMLGITEAEYVAAWVGHGAVPITTDFDRVFPLMEALGTVTALTRNESAVHEKIGIYDAYKTGKHAAMMLGSVIDMRMFPKHWAHGFAFEFDAGDVIKRSFQFFDRHGEAVHKIHLRADSNVDAWHSIVAELAIEGAGPDLAIAAIEPEVFENDGAVPMDELRSRWSAMTDTHQFPGLLNKLKLSRRRAVSAIGADYAWQVEPGSVQLMLERAAAEALPIMCFVGNRGCIQIHSGPVEKVATMGPWLNVMDRDFHLHLRQDHIADIWVVRKPVDNGHVTSVEAFDEHGGLVIQFFGKRIEGQDERAIWREIAEGLPKYNAVRAA